MTLGNKLCYLGRGGDVGKVKLLFSPFSIGLLSIFFVPMGFWNLFSGLTGDIIRSTDCLKFYNYLLSFYCCQHIIYF